eukprot:TRINITY_DN454_c0_g1_i1.p1 TRINITY_DN454_c0_g1~~TRINITY_DN454_c0_g1_i1.p1  ORF type:complete len:1217 (+),score=237.62 TRINITY_DN454_c0_g1_i1:47-3697(+)
MYPGPGPGQYNQNGQGYPQNQYNPQGITNAMGNMSLQQQPYPSGGIGGAFDAAGMTLSSSSQSGMGMAPPMGMNNPNMGMNPGMGMNSGMGMNPGMGMNSGMGMPNQGMGMNSGMGMPNQGMGMNPGMGMPNQGMGMNPGMGMPNQGMGMNSGMGMGYQGAPNMGMGGPQNMGAPNMGAPNMGMNYPMAPGSMNPNMGMGSNPGINMGMGAPNMGAPNMGTPNMGTPNMGAPNMGMNYPMAPGSMNTNTNPSPNMGMGSNPGMGMGMGMSTNPGMGMGMPPNPGMVMPNPGMGMPNSGMGMATNLGMGMATNPGMPPQRPGVNPGMYQDLSQGGVNPYTTMVWVPPRPAVHAPPSASLDIERGQLLLLGRGFEYKYMSSWVTCDVVLTTDYLQISWSRPFGIMLMLLNIHKVVETSNSVKVTLAAPDPVIGLDETHTIRISDATLRSQWVKLLQKWTRHDSGAGESFSPYLRMTNAMAFVGGSEYYPVLADSLVQAQEEILIADWWLTPEIYLKRNPIQDEWRLDNILLSKAKQGVQIKILVYCEMPATVELASERVKDYFSGLHKNFQVMRMPFRFAGANINKDYMIYSHHQKFVVIDRQLAFVGGIDLCVGRYNSHGSPLTDPDSTTFVGKDYYNPRISPPSNFEKPFEDQFDRAKHPRMPWQDVQICVDGEAAKDVALNFIQRWNVNQIRRQTFDGYMVPEFRTSDKPLNWQGDFVVYVDEAVNVKAADWNGLSDPYVIVTCKQNGKIVPERRGYEKTVVHKATLQPKWFSSFVFPNLIAQGPMTITLDVYDSDFNTVGALSRLVGLLDKVKSTTTNKVVDDFLGRVEFTVDSRLFHGKDQPVRFQENLKTEDLKKTTKGQLCFGVGFAHMRVPRKIVVPNTVPNIEVQVLRSIAHWSSGAAGYECSLYSEYLRLIQEAKHYIYIESQFFISSTATSENSSSPVTNEIGMYLIERITKAINENEKFRVIVVIPLHPEGNCLDSTTQAVLYWQQRTLTGNGDKSFFGILRQRHPNVDLNQYVCFYSLYQHGRLGNTWVSDQVYVHTKLIIIDDREMIIGSQNINDRSMRGTRDSELGIAVYSDKNMVDSFMNGVPTKVSQFVQNFRLRLWQEHLGIPDIRTMYQKYIDATSDQIYKELFLDVALKNTEILNKAFPYMPQDSITKIQEFKNRENAGARYVEELVGVQGTLICYPLKFLEQDLESLRHAISDHLFQ